MAKWYKIDCFKTHYGAGHHMDRSLYIFADDTLKALDRYKTLPGVKRDRMPLSIKALREE